jgi:CRISPR-associated protein Cmr3
MPNYQIKITPLEYYFFGGEKHNEDLTTNYFVESNDYPQQTTLLGLIRYFLLEKNNLLGGKSLPEIKREEAKLLIGESSFDYENQSQMFGAIKSISPLYFTDGKQNYTFAPIDIEFDLSPDFILNKDTKPFNAKDYSKLLKQYLVGANDGKPKSLDSIIKPVPQIGNEKERKENAFYKQNMKRLEKDWSFVIDVNIEEILDENDENDKDKIIKEQDYYLPFGGEKCFFRLSFKKQPAVDFVYSEKHERNVSSIVCISDCFVPNSILKRTAFAINNFISFRNLISAINTANFHALKAGKEVKDSMVRSDRYQLLQRGSVLYFSDKKERDDVKTEIERMNGFTIGFNTILINQIN